MRHAQKQGRKVLSTFMNDRKTRKRTALQRQLGPSKLGRKLCWYRIAHACRTDSSEISEIRVNASHLPGYLLPEISGYLAIRIRVNDSLRLRETEREGVRKGFLHA